MISATVYERDLSEVAPLALQFDREWLEEVNDCGGFSFALDNRDTDLQWCTRGRLIRFLLDGDDAVTGVIERRVRTSISPGEEVAQTTTVSGRLIGCLLEEAVVYPEGGLDRLPFADTRYFDYSSPYLDRTAWTAAVEVNQASTGVFDPAGAASYGAENPASWPDPTAFWIWSRAYVGGPPFSQPGGTSYFAKEFTFTAGIYRFSWSADNYASLSLDGIPQGSTTRLNDWQKTFFFDVELSAGTHLIAAEVTTTAEFDGNIAGLLVAVHELQISTNTLGALILHTDSTWVALDYPASPPGFSAGRVGEILLAEAQNRATIPELAQLWDAANDTATNTWDVTADISLRVGLDYRSAFRQLSETYLDWRIRVDWDTSAIVFELYVPQGLGTSTAVELEAGVNITRLQHTAAGTIQTVLLDRYFDGYTEVEDSSAVGDSGRKEAFLSLHDFRSLAEVQRVSEATLDFISTEQTATEVTHIDLGGARPYADYFLGDTLTAPLWDVDTSGTKRVMSIQVTEDRDGNVMFKPGVGTLLRPGIGGPSNDPLSMIQDSIMALEVTAKRMTNGTIAGRSLSAQPSGSLSATGSRVAPYVTAPRCTIALGNGDDTTTIPTGTLTDVEFVNALVVGGFPLSGGHLIIPRTGWWRITITGAWIINPIGSVVFEAVALEPGPVTTYGSDQGAIPAAVDVIDGFDLKPAGGGLVRFAQTATVETFVEAGIEFWLAATQTSGSDADLVAPRMTLTLVCGDTPTLVT